MRSLPERAELDLGVIDVERDTVWLRANFAFLCRGLEAITVQPRWGIWLNRYQAFALAYHATAERLNDLGYPDPRPWPKSPKNPSESVDGRPAPRLPNHDPSVEG